MDGSDSQARIECCTLSSPSLPMKMSREREVPAAPYLPVCSRSQLASQNNGRHLVHCRAFSCQGPSRSGSHGHGACWTHQPSSIGASTDCWARGVAELVVPGTAVMAAKATARRIDRRPETDGSVDLAAAVVLVLRSDARASHPMFAEVDEKWGSLVGSRFCFHWFSSDRIQVLRVT
jgi:hypothetical protein